ncbi:MAG: hypothetical protein NTW30_04465 [Candidatus Aenigmarchaeota archaeon]|nr:hypothetical protein [Candidatus Aenigmarchaeota archaeon]
MELIELTMLIVAISIMLIISYFMFTSRTSKINEPITEEHAYARLGDVVTSFYNTKISGTKRTLAQLLADRVVAKLANIDYGEGVGIINVDKQVTEFFDAYLDKKWSLSNNQLSFGHEIPNNINRKISYTIMLPVIQYELSSETLELLNGYLKNYPVSEPLMIVNIGNFSCVDTPVEGLEGGLKDENVTVNAYGSNISISMKENNVSSSNGVFEFIPENRFWFLYRKLRDWTNSNGWEFKKRVCDCLKNGFFPHTQRCKEMNNCDDCTEFKQCFELAIKETSTDIENFINDQNVTCKGTPTCCYGRKDPCVTGTGNDCSYWSGGGGCNSCNILHDNPLCIESIGASSNDYKDFRKEDVLSFEGENEKYSSLSSISFSPDICGGSCVFYEAGYVNVKAQFTCTDKKYKLSLPLPEERFLKFTIDTMVSLQKEGINNALVPCSDSPPCECEGQLGIDWCSGNCYVVTTTPTPVITTATTTPITIIVTTTTFETTTTPTTTPRPTTIPPTTYQPVTTRPRTTAPPSTTTTIKPLT